MISMDVEISKFFIYVTYILLQLSKNFFISNSTITVSVFVIKDFFGFFKFSTAKKHCGIYQIRTKAETSVPGAKNRD